MRKERGFVALSSLLSLSVASSLCRGLAAGRHRPAGMDLNVSALNKPKNEFFEPAWGLTRKF